MPAKVGREWQREDETVKPSPEDLPVNVKEAYINSSPLPFGEVLKDIKVDTATQNVDITGLDLVNHEAYKIFIRIVNDSGSLYDLDLYFNGNYTDSDYQTVRTGSVYGGGISNIDYDKPFISGIADGTELITILTIGLSRVVGVGYLAGFQSRQTHGTLTSLSDVSINGKTKFLADNLTELRFHAEEADGIGAGSRIRIMPFTPEYSL